jgi:hypothetical protein
MAGTVLRYGPANSSLTKRSLGSSKIRPCLLIHLPYSRTARRAFPAFSIFQTVSKNLTNMFRSLPPKTPIDLSTNLPSLSKCLESAKNLEREDALMLLRRRTSWDIQSVFLVIVISFIFITGNHGYLAPYLTAGVFAYCWYQTRTISRRLDALILVIREDRDRIINDNEEEEKDPPSNCDKRSV